MSSRASASSLLVVVAIGTVLFVWGFANNSSYPPPSSDSNRHRHQQEHQERHHHAHHHHDQEGVKKWQEEEEEEYEDETQLFSRMAIENGVDDDDQPMHREVKLWFMLRQRGWQKEKEYMRAIEVVKRMDALFTDINKQYFLMHGSLLGHCRHAGFIPWDDDMDMVTDQSTVNWLATEEGARVCAAHGLERFVRSTGFIKLYLAGEDIPRAGGYGWGFPFIDIFPYLMNSTSGLMQIHDDEMELDPKLVFPIRRVAFHPGVPNGVLVPFQPGTVLDTFFPGWRVTCKMARYNHRHEYLDDSLQGPCKVLSRLAGLRLAPATRCPSASMLALDQDKRKRH